MSTTEEQCDNVPDTSCRDIIKTVSDLEYDEQCRTEFEQQCRTEFEDVCNIVNQRECSTVNTRACSNLLQKECKVGGRDDCNGNIMLSLPRHCPARSARPSTRRAVARCAPPSTTPRSVRMSVRRRQLRIARPSSRSSALMF